MNFQDVRNAPEKQWVEGIELTILNLTNAPNDKWGNYIQQILGKDGAGEQAAFRLQTKFPEGLLDNNDLNQTMPFRLKWFNSKQGAQMSGYSTKPKAMGGPAPAFGVPPTPQQQMPAPRDYDKENLGKCRFGLYQATIQAGCRPEALDADTKLLMALESLAKKCMDGIGGLPNPDYVGGPPVDDSDVPF